MNMMISHPILIILIILITLFILSNYEGRAQKPSATYVGENVAWENATVSWVLKSER